MSTALVSTPPRLPRLTVLRSAAIAVAITAVIMVALFHGNVGRMGQYAAAMGGAFAHPHWPDIRPLVAAGPVVLLHVGTALSALAIGIFLMSYRKGRTLHRAMGWTWVIAMLITAFSTLFIRGINAPNMSWIYGFSFYVLGAAPLAVWFARRHNVKAHRGMMTGMFIGALIIAGAFSFLPGRTMWHVFFG